LVVGLKLFHVEQFEMGRRGNRDGFLGGRRNPIWEELGQNCSTWNNSVGGPVEIVPRGTI